MRKFSILWVNNEVKFQRSNFQNSIHIYDFGVFVAKYRGRMSAAFHLNFVKNLPQI